MGGQTISSLTNSPGQCEIVKNRTRSSSAYNESIGKVQGFQAHRLNRIKELYAGTGDSNNLYTVTKGAEKMFIWQPALGIFDSPQVMGAGEYDIQLNPSQDYQMAAVDTGNSRIDESYTVNAGAGGGHFEVIVKNIRFYACLVRANLPSSGVETLHLMEMSVQTANVKGGGPVDINEEVNFPSSTRAITMFLQDKLAGKHSAIPPSKFHVTTASGGDVLPSDALSLQSYQIQYANLTKPTVMYSSDYQSTKNTLQQRYINTALETGGYFNDSGYETFEEWLERGPLIHETFIKSADNLATRAQIQAKYGNVTNDARLYLIAHYSTTVQITRASGMITNVHRLDV